MLYKTTVNRILKQIRQQKGRTQSEIARYSSITQSELSNFESGKLDIRLSTLNRIATALDMKIVPIPKNKLEEIEHILSEETKTPPQKPTTLLDKYGISDEE